MPAFGPWTVKLRGPGGPVAKTRGPGGGRGDRSGRVGCTAPGLAEASPEEGRLAAAAPVLLCALVHAPNSTPLPPALLPALRAAALAEATAQVAAGVPLLDLPEGLLPEPGAPLDADAAEGSGPADPPGMAGLSAQSVEYDVFVCDAFDDGSFERKSCRRGAEEEAQRSTLS